MASRLLIDLRHNLIQDSRMVFCKEEAGSEEPLWTLDVLLRWKQKRQKLKKH
jgi:hypothetical protein